GDRQTASRGARHPFWVSLRSFVALHKVQRVWCASRRDVSCFARSGGKVPVARRRRYTQLSEAGMSVIKDAVAAWKVRLAELDEQIAPLADEAEQLRAAIARLETIEPGGSPRRPAPNGD